MPNKLVALLSYGAKLSDAILRYRSPNRDPITGGIVRRGYLILSDNTNLSSDNLSLRQNLSIISNEPQDYVLIVLSGKSGPEPSNWKKVSNVDKELKQLRVPEDLTNLLARSKSLYKKLIEFNDTPDLLNKLGRILKGGGGSSVMSGPADRKTIVVMMGVPSTYILLRQEYYALRSGKTGILKELAGYSSLQGATTHVINFDLSERIFSYLGINPPHIDLPKVIIEGKRNNREPSNIGNVLSTDGVIQLGGLELRPYIDFNTKCGRGIGSTIRLRVWRGITPVTMPNSASDLLNKLSGEIASLLRGYFATSQRQNEVIFIDGFTTYLSPNNNPIYPLIDSLDPESFRVRIIFVIPGVPEDYLEDNRREAYISVLRNRLMDFNQGIKSITNGDKLDLRVIFLGNIMEENVGNEVERTLGINFDKIIRPLPYMRPPEIGAGEFAICRGRGVRELFGELYDLVMG